MVVCKCRKATKLYCFVHKCPVCPDCICNQEHKLCVVKTYSDWVIDGDYDWPPKCGVCDKALEATDKTLRLNCLHALHSHCFEQHLDSFPSYTAPAGFTCRVCSAPIWPPPPKNLKDASLPLYANVREAISRTPKAQILLGGAGADHVPAGSASQAASASLAASSQSSLLQPGGQGVGATSAAGGVGEASSSAGGGGGASSAEALATAAAEAEAAAQAGHGGTAGPTNAVPTPSREPSRKGVAPVSQQAFAAAATRKGSARMDRTAVDLSYADDDDAEDRKYARRGPFYRPLLAWLVPLWGPSLPALPVTAPKREDEAAEALIDGRGGRRRSRGQRAMDPRKMLLIIALLSCLTTMLLLYYRLGQTPANPQIHEEHILP